ncbi:MAG: 2-hydroxyacyl-CoA dehydratase [Nitrospirae bacterium]|nr:2-hydroxyacyl-CoA dehydratase [Nitrospirota bacterium]
MSKDYKEMWNNLGLNLKAHDGLLSVLTEAYKNIYLSQKNRPKGMGYFDFVVSEVHGLRIEELLEAKESGRKIIGTFCIFVPEELVLATDAVFIGLCSGADIGSDEAEKYIPKNTCALIKSFMGFKASGLCPYVESTDLIVGETTCDGKKKAFEIFNDITGKVYVIEVPNKQGETDINLWKAEIKKFAEKLENLTGKKITIEKLRAASKIVNNKRKALQRLSLLRANDPSPISGLDALLINQISFYDDPIRFTLQLNELCDELDDRVRVGIGATKKGAKRVLIGGSPMAIPNWKTHAIIEGSGAIVVGEEACVGERSYRTLVDLDNAEIEEAYDIITNRYISLDCACFTPNNDRMKNIKDMVRTLKADGFIHYALQFCTPYTMESYKAKNTIATISLPFLKIETDYSMEDMGQLKTRIEAFLEMIKESNSKNNSCCSCRRK